MRLQDSWKQQEGQRGSRKAALAAAASDKGMAGLSSRGANMAAAAGTDGGFPGQEGRRRMCSQSGLMVCSRLLAQPL